VLKKPFENTKETAGEGIICPLRKMNTERYDWAL